MVLIDESELKKWRTASKIIYLNTSGFSMNEAGNQRVSDLVAGNILIIDQENKDYWSVRYPDQRKAKVAKKEARGFQNWKEEITLSDSSIINTAKNLMGVPYLWGGTSTKGVDCSGFTKSNGPFMIIYYFSCHAVRFVKKIFR